MTQHDIIRYDIIVIVKQYKIIYNVKIVKPIDFDLINVTILIIEQHCSRNTMFKNKLKISCWIHDKYFWNNFYYASSELFSHPTNIETKVV